MRTIYDREVIYAWYTVSDGRYTFGFKVLTKVLLNWCTFYWKSYFSSTCIYATEMLNRSIFLQSAWTDTKKLKWIWYIPWYIYICKYQYRYRYKMNGILQVISVRYWYRVLVSNSIYKEYKFCHDVFFIFLLFLDRLWWSCLRNLIKIRTVHWSWRN
jgi:hypothetical protein